MILDVLITDGAIDVLIDGEALDVELDAGPLEVVEDLAGVAGPPGPAGGLTLSRPAGRALSGHRAVLTRADGAADYPDLAVAADADLVTGLTIAAAVQGASVQVQRAGELVEPSWAWSPGPIFCGVAGELTQVEPLDAAFIVQVAVAIGPTRILVGVQPPILL